MKSKIFVLILGYNDLKNLEECFGSLSKQSYKNYEVWFADNNSNDGSIEYTIKKFPWVKVFQFNENSGYAGGNNKMLRKAFAQKADFCLLLNADTKVDKNFLSGLINTFNEKSKKYKVGLIQPTIMLYDQPEKINTIGNTIHYLGFGYCGNYLKTKIPRKDKEIISVSGAAMLVSRAYYENVGLLDEDFFMYNEDQNYSWRGLMLGYHHFLSVKAKIWHKYNFSKNKNKMYHSEKNRLMMLFENYEGKTLLKLLPIIVLNEVLMLVYSLFNGWIGLKIKSYKFLCKNKYKIKQKRKEVEVKRLLPDRKIILKFGSKLDFDELNNPIIKFVINPIYSTYRKVLF